MNSTKQAPVHQAGFHISIWCRAVGISRASYYNLPPDLQPESVKIGRRHLVIEQPESYLKRIAKRAAEEKRKAA